MELTVLEQGPARRIAIADEITIADAAVLRDELALALTTSSSLEIDLTGIESCDISGLQILSALLREAHPIRILGASEALLDTVELLRLEALLDACPHKEPA